MTERITVSPSYGRDYTSKKAALDDWLNGKDFRIVGGPYINKQDAEREGLAVTIRYDQLRRSVMVP